MGRLVEGEARRRNCMAGWGGTLQTFCRFDMYIPGIVSSHSRKMRAEMCRVVSLEG